MGTKVEGANQCDEFNFHAETVRKYGGRSAGTLHG